MVEAARTRNYSEREFERTAEGNDARASEDGDAGAAAGKRWRRRVFCLPLRT